MATRYAGTAGVAPLWRRGEASPRSPSDRRERGRPRGREREVEERDTVRTWWCGCGTPYAGRTRFPELRAHGIGTWTRSRKYSLRCKSRFRKGQTILILIKFIQKIINICVSE